jgi:PhnB protein
MKKIPEGFNTVTASVVVSDAKAAIALYEKGFGAKLNACLECPKTGKVLHACLQIGTSILFLCDENEEMQIKAPGADGSSLSFYLYVEDVDASHKQAVASGFQEISPPTDQFWGDRMGVVSDSFGYKWQFATHVRDVSDEEIAEAMKQMTSSVS